MGTPLAPGAAMHALPSLLAAREADPIGRALASAAVVGGVLVELPCRFRLVTGIGGVWVVVACPTDADPARAAFHRERTLTAVQRLMLSLWSEGVAAVWETAPVAPDALPDLGDDVLLGRVWCPAEDESAAPTPTAAAA